MRYMLFLICLSTLNIRADARINTHALQVNVTLEKSMRASACQGYDENFITLAEMIYGKGFLSQGGEESVREMIAGSDLNGLNVLDIGSGLGGPALYLAKTSSAKITAIEPQKWMVEKAEEHLKEVKGDLLGSVEFIHMEMASNLMNFASNTFDVVISKEALLHIPVSAKREFLTEIQRVLKPGGTLIILDWMHSSSKYSENTKKMMGLNKIAYNLTSPKRYKKTLLSTGFSTVTIEDMTKKNAFLSQENINTIKFLQPQITKKYGSKAYEDSLQVQSWQKDAFERRELLIGLIKAIKY